MKTLKDYPVADMDQGRDWMQVKMLLRQKNYNRAYYKLSQKLKKGTPSAGLRRFTAHILEVKVNFALESADRLRIKPDINLLREYLEKAVRIDANLPGPYWLQAVLAARFTREYSVALEFLKKARSSGYKHDLMPFIEELSRKGQEGHPLAPERWQQLSAGEHELRLIGWRLMLWPDISYAASLNLLQRDNLAEEVLFCGREEILDANFKLLRNFMDKKIITGQDVRNCLKLSGLFSGKQADSLAHLLRTAADFTGEQELRRKAAENHIRILVEESFNRCTGCKMGDKGVEEARNLVRQAIELAESLPFEIDQELHEAMFMAYRYTFIQPLPLQRPLSKPYR